MHVSRPPLSEATRSFLRRRAAGNGLLIGAEWAAAAATLPTLDPAAGEQHGVVPCAGADEAPPPSPRRARRYRAGGARCRMGS